MSDPFRISVVIPTRHRNDLLALCLDRLKPGVQTLPAEQYEVIVTDDGSDATAEAMIAAKYPWARWTAGPRKGPAANRNHGAGLARGDFLAFTDDDCLPSEQWLAAFVAASASDVQVYEGRTVCLAGVISPMMHSPTNGEGGWLWSCNMMVRRAFFEQFRFDEAFPYPHMEDVYFRERLKRTHEPFLFVSEALIDHPPRRVPSGYKWAATHECEIIYHYKMNEQPLPLMSYLWRLIKARSRNILRYRISRDSFVAGYHAAVEIGCVIVRYNHWKRLHNGDITGDPGTFFKDR